ncbi:hypothetical protein SAMD00019534_020800 [Acytostelium subglobosum LB1]|uniref:hypothetical protein n=1 Tax=Acytostelium subglobosum LB1 TaxID=1410327 RepID=UPI000645207D|nr:hypothetical protein SAMD00019534_020800 [Acytostelium subglobosum LB1]GAM18905.1 hypothetical protein SAMD00019534_020800 [Acytostelium subglobosum LB1]|eukprot:XP_012758125.1 hypothetical protein SAMD00019534_020800 [Acytostelium subglobosum LB1]
MKTNTQKCHDYLLSELGNNLHELSIFNFNKTIVYRPILSYVPLSNARLTSFKFETYDNEPDFKLLREFLASHSETLESIHLGIGSQVNDKCKKECRKLVKSMVTGAFGRLRSLSFGTWAFKTGIPMKNPLKFFERIIQSLPNLKILDLTHILDSEQDFVTWFNVSAGKFLKYDMISRLQLPFLVTKKDIELLESLKEVKNLKSLFIKVATKDLVLSSSVTSCYFNTSEVLPEHLEQLGKNNSNIQHVKLRAYYLKPCPKIYIKFAKSFTNLRSIKMWLTDEQLNLFTINYLVLTKTLERLSIKVDFINLSQWFEYLNINQSIQSVKIHAFEPEFSNIYGMFQYEPRNRVTLKYLRFFNY